MSARAAAPAGVRVWLAGIRPRTLGIGAAPVALGSALAWHDGVFALPQALAALAGAVLLQAGSNLVNDLGDFLHGADRADRLGPPRLAQSGLASPRSIGIAAALVFLLATLCGAVLVAHAGWPVVAIGLVSIASAIAYTAGPVPLGYRGFGEVMVFAFFGPVALAGTYFVQGGTWSPAAFALSVPAGALASAVLLVNNIRDADTDRQAGKNTIVVRFGRKFGCRLHAACLVLGVAGLAASGLFLGAPGTLLALVASPLALKLVREVRLDADAPGLNRALVRTAALAAIVPVLAALGLLL